MDQILNEKTVRRMAYTVTVIFLIIHMVLFVLFTKYGVTPMARFNIFSMVFYLLMMTSVVHRDRWRLFAVAVFLEVATHMTLATYCVGWDSGFQITLVGINILAFYSEYVGRTLQYSTLKGKTIVYGLPLSLLGMACYFLAFYLCATGEPPYPLDPQVSMWFHAAWSVITFVITIAFLQVLVLLSFHSEEFLARQLAHDKLTALPNRYHLASYLKSAAEERGLEGKWLAMADIDNFKRINDTYGHNCGDYVLKTLADIIRECEVGEELCRWGGEEFVLVGNLDEHGQIPYEQLERLRKTIEEHRFWYEEHRLNLTVTIGVARYAEGTSSNEWVNAADKKLYEGKCAGKNRVAA